MKTLSSFCATSISTLFALSAFCGSRHAGNPVHPTYEGRVMAGYQGWFHNRSGGVMYPNEESVRIDMWPDVSEYEKTYPTGLKLSNGEGARFFCSDDEVNEGTAIFKVTDEPPVGEMVKFAKMDGLPSDHYLFLTGEAAKLLRGERKPTPTGELPIRTSR